MGTEGLRKRRCLAPALLAVFFASGCIYTHVTVPLDVDLNETPFVAEGATSNIRTLRYRVRVDWGSNAIGAIMKEHDLAVVHYADVETLRVLGLWEQQFVHVYGERRAPRGGAIP